MNPGDLRPWSALFLPQQSGNQHKKPVPEKEVLDEVSSLFRSSENAPGWGTEGKGITIGVSVALGGRVLASNPIYLSLSPVLPIYSKSTP